MPKCNTVVQKENDPFEPAIQLNSQENFPIFWHCLVKMCKISFNTMDFNVSEHLPDQVSIKQAFQT